MALQTTTFTWQRVMIYVISFIVVVIGIVVFIRLRSVQSCQKATPTSTATLSSPRTTLVPFSQWKTYTDKDARYTINYPPNWQQLPQPSDALTISTADYATYPLNGVVIKGAVLSILPHHAVHEDDPALTIWSKRHFRIGEDYPVRYVVTVSNAGSGDIVYVIHNNTDYEISMFYDPARKVEFTQLFDKLLTTLKFIN